MSSTYRMRATQANMKVKIFTDGAARNNPGDAGIGVVIKHDNKTLKEIGDYVGKTTNNVAEYMALIRGLEEALLLRITELEVYSDSVSCLATIPSPLTSPF